MTHTSDRLYGLMQSLMTDAAAGRTPTAADARNIVQEQDAVNAVLILASGIDQNTQAGRIPVHQAQHMASMLMVIRDYIRPLPVGLEDDGTAMDPDGVTPDLQEIVDALRTGSGLTDFEG